MAFTFTNYPILTPEQQSPWQGALSRALDTYSKATKASYMPRQMEADLFAKEIGPLAGLASSPNFTGFNPEIQKMIAQRIGGYLGHGQGGAGGAAGQESAETPGYAEDEDIYNRLSTGAKQSFGPGAKGRVNKSRLASLSEQLGLPNQISKALGGSEAAGQLGAFEQAKTEAEQRLVMKGYSPEKAKRAVQELPNEPADAYAKRIKSLFVAGDKGASKSEEKQIDREDEGQTIQLASNIAQQIKSKLGKDIPETVIANYLFEHPGKVHIPSLLKAAGVR